MCEYVAGYTATSAAEAALHERRRTGRGQHIDISAMESMLSVHQTTFGRLALGEPRRRTGRYYEIYPMGSRPCRDGWVLLSVVTDEEYDRFLIAIGRTDLAADERFADRQSRVINRDAFDVEMAPFLEAHEADEIVEILHRNGVAAAKVAEAEDVFLNPQLAHRGFWGQGPGPGNPVPPAQVYGAPVPRLRSALAWPTARRPLEGIVVADFSVFWAGPSTTRALAELGARVIWVERPHSRADPDLATTDVTALAPYMFDLKMNRGKQSVVLDLTTPEGHAAARRLVAEADVVVENNRPGVMDTFGLGPADLCSLHPRLVYVSLSGYGSTGPWAQRRSYGPTIEAASSIEGRTGYAGDQPLRLGHPLPDGTGGIAGAYAALRGLRGKKRGVGGWIDMSQLETYVAMGGEDLIERRPLARLGNSSRWGVRQGIYRCTGIDEWVAIRLANVTDEKAFTAATGANPADEVAVAAFMAGCDRWEVARVLQAAGIEAFPALRPEDLVVDPQLHQRRFLLDVRLGELTVTLPGSSLYPLADPSGRPPKFGEHTSAVLAELARLEG